MAEEPRDSSDADADTLLPAQQDPSQDRTALAPVDPAGYALGAEIARGGMGRIVAARDLRLGRPVAVKQVLAGSPEVRARFEREARVTARLQHPAIVPVYEAGSLGGEPFYAMKLVSGRTLDAVIAAAPTLAARLARLPNVIAVVEAIAYAHAERVIHRDLKPHNVLVGDFGETVVIDWGLAKDLAAHDGVPELPAGPYRAGASDATVAGAVMGTPAYMPPEQAEGKAVDERADVYALGAMLHHLLAGRPPFVGKSSEEVLARVLSEPPGPLPPEVPRDLAAIVRRGMAGDPAARPTAAQLAEELRRFHTGKLVESHEYTAWELARRWLGRHRAVVAVAVLALAVIAIGGVVSIRRIMGERNAARAATVVAEQQRATAERERAAAEEHAAQGLEEQGRQLLLAGAPARAAVYLDGAYRRSREKRASLRFLLGSAMQVVDAQLYDVPDALGLTGGRLWVRDGARLRGLDPATGRPLVELDGALQVEDLWSPGAGLVAARGGGRVVLWDAASGKRRAELEVGERSLTLSPDGRLAAIHDQDSHIEIRDLVGGSPPVSVDVDDDLLQVVFTGDGARFATAGSGVHVYEARTGKELLVTADSAEYVEFVAGDTRLVAGPDNNRGLFDARTGKALASWPDGVVVDIGPDEKWGVLLGSDQRPQVVDLVTGKTIGRLDALGSNVYLSPDGRRAAVTAGRRVALCNTSDGAQTSALEGHTDDVTEVVWSRDTNRLVTTAKDGTIRLWRSDDGAPLASLDTVAGADRVALAADDSVLVAVLDDHHALAWNIAAATGTVAALPADVQIGDEDRLLRTVDGRITLYDAATGTEVRTLAPADAIRRPRLVAGHVVAEGRAGGVTVFGSDGVGHEFTDAFAAAPDHAGKRVVTLGSKGALVVRDLGTQARLHEITLPINDSWSFTARFAAGDALVVASSGGKTWLWQPGQAAPLALLDRAAVSPGGDAVAGFTTPGGAIVGVAARGVEVRETRTGAIIGALPDQPGQQLWLSPGGAHVVVLTEAELALWDPAAGRRLMTLERKGSADDVAFSPDGARLLTWQDGKTVQVWDATSGRLLMALEHDQDVAGASFDPSGRWIVISTDGEGPDALCDATTGTVLARGRGGQAFVAHGRRRLTCDDGGCALLAVPFEERDPAVIAAQVQARVPLELRAGRLMPRQRPPAR